MTAETDRLQFNNRRRAHWDQVAELTDSWTGWGGAYHRRLRKVYRFLIPPGRNVLELGCARGELLSALKPERGVGVDMSPEMILRARQQHPQLEFIEANAHDLNEVNGSFDHIVMSDLVNDLWDIQTIFDQLHRLCHPGTRLILNTHSNLWAWPLALAQKLRLAKPRQVQNWLTPEDIENLLALSGFEVIRKWPEILWPLKGGWFADLCNRYLVRLWPFRHLALANFILARPTPTQDKAQKLPRVSVIVPARNEAGNIAEIFQRVPQMGAGTELVFVEGHSSDDTFEKIKQEIRNHPDIDSQLHQQSGAGKGDAVRLGFDKASGEVLMILDADLTVSPETLPRFLDALISGQGDYINGVRLVYPMEDQAMRFLNLVGNKFFSLAFSWLLGQPIKDTLCGTKVLWKKDYEAIAANREYFGEFDPFGDFDLIFGSARLGLKIVDMPVRYSARTYGTTNIQRWRHGWLLIRMVLFAARRIKFI